MEYLRVFATQDKYIDADINPPTISYIIETNEFKFDSESYVNAIYNVSSISESTRLLWFGLNQVYKMFVDDKEISPTQDLIFDCLGEHTVRYVFKNLTNCSKMFKHCVNLTSVDLRGLDTSKVTDMSWMFQSCVNLTSVDLRGIDTSKVTDMSYMFTSCKNLTNVNLKSLNTSKVTDMSYMFSGCSGLLFLNLSYLNTSNLRSFSGVFYGCDNLTSVDLRGIDTSKVTDMSYMFYSCKNLTTINLKSFNTSKVTTMEEMFRYCYNLSVIDLSSFDTSSVNNMEGMFYNCTSLIQLIMIGNVYYVAMYGNMFYGINKVGTLIINCEYYDSWMYKLETRREHSYFPKSWNVICNS